MSTTLVATTTQTEHRYASITQQLRAIGLTPSELAEIAGVQTRQVYRWENGEFSPQGTAKDHLLDLDYVVKQLSEVYTEQGIDIWLHSRNRLLNGQRPIELLKEGNFAEVIRMVEQLQVGAF